MAEITATLTLTDTNFVRFGTQESSWHGFTHKIIIKAADIADAGSFAADDTLLLTLFTAPANSIVLDACARVVTAFTTTSCFGTDGTLAVGIASDPDAVIDEHVVNATSVQKFVGTGDTSAAAKAITLRAVPTSGGDLDNTAAGEYHIYLKMPALDKAN